MEQFLAMNPNPVISVEKDGTVLYSNKSGEPLLHEWGVEVGEKLPSYIRNIVQRVISRDSPEKMEVKVGKKVYLVSYYPLPEEGCVNIYGFDISGQKEFEGKLKMELAERKKTDRELRKVYEKTQKQSEELQVFNEELQVQSEELYEANEALKKSEKRFRTLAENSPDVITRFDRQNRHMYANPAASEAYSLSHEEIIGKTHGELGENPEQVRFFETYQEIVFTTGKTETMEFQYTSPQGKEYHFNTKIVPEFVDGKVTSILAISRDITERKKIEEALKKAHDSLEEKVKERTSELEEAYKLSLENERRLDEAQEMAHIGSWDQNLITNELYWSDETYRIFGFKPKEFIATYDAFLSHIHPDDRDNVNDAVRKTLNGKPFGIDFRIILADGAERVVHAQGGAAFDEKNMPIRVKGTVQDITERKRAEKTLQASEKRLLLAQQAARIGTFEWNIRTGVNIWTPELEAMYGLRPGEFGKTELAWEQLIHSDDRPNALRMVEHAFQTGEPTEGEWRVVWPDGSMHWLTGRWQVFKDATGQPMQMTGVNIDITERRKVEEALAKIEISQKQEIHHRIKNNLQVISSLLDLQAEQFKDRENIKDSEILNAFRESQDRVISMALIHEELYKGGGFDTLDFSRYIEELADNLFLTYRIRNKNISLNMDLDESLFFDMDTAVPLGIIVNELVSNSLKHAFIGRDKGEIEIKICKDESSKFESNRKVSNNENLQSTSFNLTVSDNGTGIPDDLNIENLDSLGLQLVTSLVDQLEGEFELKRNNGTEFIIRFTLRAYPKTHNYVPKSLF